MRLIVFIVLSFLGVLFADSGKIRLMLKSRPNSPILLEALAKAYYEEGKFEHSLKVIESLEKIDPGSRSVPPLKAYVLQRLDQPWEAFLVCRENITIPQCNHFITGLKISIKHLSEVYEFLFDLKKEKKLNLNRTSAILQKFPDNQLLLKELALLFENNQMLEMAQDIWKLSAYTPIDKEMLFLNSAKDFRTSLIKMAKNLDTPEAYHHHLYLWKLAPDLGERFQVMDIRKTLKWFEEKMETEGENFDFSWRLGSIYCRIYDDKKCHQWFQKAIELAPNSFYATLMQMLYTKKSKIKKDVAITKEALAKVPGASEHSFFNQEKNKTHEWIIPASLESFESLVLSSDKNIILQFCTIRAGSCLNTDTKWEEIKKREELMSLTKMMIDPQSPAGAAISRRFPSVNTNLYLLTPKMSVLGEYSTSKNPEELLKKITDQAEKKTAP